MVSGWFKDEFTHLGEPWLEHDERYRRSAEFLQVLRKIWTEDDVDFRGDFYRIHDFTLKPKPLNTAERPESRVVPGRQLDGGAAQRRLLRRLVLLQRQGLRRGDRADRRGARPRARRRPRGQVRAERLHHRPRHREAEARETLREIVDKANRPAVEGFRAAVQQAGNSTADKRGMWADSTFEDLVQYNDGFRTQLIGTPEQIAERIAAYRKRGVDLILGGFLHFQEEIEYFGSRVLPLVREIENAEENWADAPVLVVRMTRGALAWCRIAHAVRSS